jgi:hypothetical protein
MLTFDEKQIAVMDEKLSEMCTDGEVAAALGINGNTFLNHKKKDPVFAEYYERGKEKGKSAIRHLAYESARGCAPKPLLDADGNQVYKKNGEPATYGGREPNITMQIALCNTYLGFKERQNGGEVVIRVETDA